MWRLLGSSQGQVTSTPTAGSLPGSSELQALAGGIEYWALLLTLVGLLVGAAVWALGSHSQNYQQAYHGRRAVLVSAAAALLVGAAPGIVNFFFNAGTTVGHH